MTRSDHSPAISYADAMVLHGKRSTQPVRAMSHITFAGLVEALLIRQPIELQKPVRQYILEFDWDYLTDRWSCLCFMAEQGIDISPVFRRPPEKDGILTVKEGKH